MLKRKVESNEYWIPIEIEPLEEGGFLATSSVLQGFLAQGRTLAETMEIAQDVARKLIESYIEHGDPLPREVVKAMKKSKRARVKTSVPVTVPV
jgi:predicted RNase H-like HicB family nuclease